MFEKPPNFLVICTDQMRADHLGCADNPMIRTPNIDRLAASSTQLDRAYVNCPLCQPSRATLFTGMTPRGHQVRTNGIPLAHDIPTLTTSLSDAGYRTSSIGKLHFSNYWLDDNVLQVAEPQSFPEVQTFWQDGKIHEVPVPYYGFDQVDITLGHGDNVEGNYGRWLRESHPEAWRLLQDKGVLPSASGAEQSGTFPIHEDLHHTAYVADKTIDQILKTARSSPFFLFCSFPDPHHPYVAPRPWDTLYGNDEVVPPVSREDELDSLAPHFRKIIETDIMVSGRRGPTGIPPEHVLEALARTYGMVSLIDKHVGRILAALDESGQRDNTVVVFLSDHGDLMGDHGLMNKGPWHFEGLLRVPMIWSWPGHIRVQRTQALASLLDFAPTVLDLAGVDTPNGLASDVVAPERPPAWPGRSLKGVLKGDTEIVQDSVVVENDEDYLGLRLRTLITDKLKITTYTGHRGPEPYGELFDLETDPSELHNLWEAPEVAALRSELIERLHYRLTETDIAVPRRLSHA